MRHADVHLADVLGRDATDKRVDILRRIGEAGSISEAARGAGVSYKAAWQALETLSNLAGTSLVEKAVGGTGGGGAALTDAGRRVLEAAALLDRARSEVLARFGRAGGGAAGEPGVAALALRTSMRNVLPCTVGALASREGFVRVGLVLAGGGALHSRITRESAQLLGLRRGAQVLALCKATAVSVAPRIAASASRNVLAGVVSRVSRSARGGEASLRLPGNLHVVGFARPGHGLKAGDDAMASVDESGVVVAIAG